MFSSIPYPIISILFNKIRCEQEGDTAEKNENWRMDDAKIRVEVKSAFGVLVVEGNTPKKYYYGSTWECEGKAKYAARNKKCCSCKNEANKTDSRCRGFICAALEVDWVTHVERKARNTVHNEDKRMLEEWNQAEDDSTKK